MHEIIVDNFAGGGGASTGIELATGCPVTIAINHDPDAISMHKANHPYTTHYCESVWDVNPEEICKGRPVGLMWLSPDCKHFSRAKGGTPVNKNIRGLAWIACRWAATVRPRVIILENVKEFMTWGPVRDGKPIAEKKGITFRHFVNTLKSRGYDVEWTTLKACDFGAPTSRERFFMVARCDGKPIVFPKPTHGNPESTEVKSGKLLPWRTAAECIDWSIPCGSIFNRKKPLAENTMRRIARGMDKFVIKSKNPFIVQYIMANNNNNIGSGINEPLHTITTGNRHFYTAPSLIQYHSETSEAEVRGQTLNSPVMTVDGSPRYALSSVFLQKYYGGNYTGAGSNVKEPVHTITAIDHNALTESHLCIMRRNQDCGSFLQPIKTITASPGHFAQVKTYLIRYSGQADLGRWSLERDMLNKYCGYNIADDEVLIFEINKIQYFISDIGMRMLTPRELYNAQGFPNDYIIDVDCNGKAYPKTKQVARCGNAVPPPFAEALVRANLPEMCGNKIFSLSEIEKPTAI